VSAPGVTRYAAPLGAVLSALGLSKATKPGAVGERPIAATLASSETFRWLRRWAVVGVVAIVTPITVIAAYADEMPEFHHVAVPLAVAIIVPVWVLELLGVRLPRLILIAATVLPNVWLTLIGHTSTNYLWLPLLIAWAAFSGTLVEGIVALTLASATIGLSAAMYGWGGSGLIEWVFSFLLAWFLGLVLRRQVDVVAQLRLLRGESEARAREVAVLEERQRLSRELHDSVTQALYGISLYAEAGARAHAEGDSEPVANNLREIRDTTQEALGEMRLLLFELRPPLLEEHGLAAALRTRLQAVEARSGLATDFVAEGEERLHPDAEQELYRVAQEALNNVLKHAHAARVSVRLAVVDGRATLDVADDGVGFEPSLLGASGLGLRGMRERADRLGGTFRIDSSPGRGTRVHVEVSR
jgi:signal transduction histidine kinase